MMEIIDASDSKKLESLYRGGWDAPQNVIDGVGTIVRAVREHGDDAVIEYTRRFDDANFELTQLHVPIPPRSEARRLVPDDVARALELARERVAHFHEKQRRSDIVYSEDDGTRYGFY